MKLLQVSRLNHDLLNRPEGISSAHLDSLPREPISITPWPAFPYRPEVSFSIAYGPQHLFLKYFVTEQHLRATVSTTNGPVWEDSCVECFLAFDDVGYYNIECNCIGTVHAAFGATRANRKLLSEQTVAKLRYEVSIADGDDGQKKWTLFLTIPVSFFTHHQVTTLEGLPCRANFYKCGDKLPQPHYVTWSPVATPEPDFHTPKFFGQLQFT